MFTNIASCCDSMIALRFLDAHVVVSKCNMVNDTPVLASGLEDPHGGVGMMTQSSSTMSIDVISKPFATHGPSCSNIKLSN